jgi:hypothetical protein
MTDDERVAMVLASAALIGHHPRPVPSFERTIRYVLADVRAESPCWRSSQSRMPDGSWRYSYRADCETQYRDGEQRPLGELCPPCAARKERDRWMP